MIRIYIIGIAILLIAIVANGIVLKIGIKSWYDFLRILSNSGIAGFKQLSVLDYLWLFVGYPFVLGIGYWVGNHIFKLFS